MEPEPAVPRMKEPEPKPVAPVLHIWEPVPEPPVPVSKPGTRLTGSDGYPARFHKNENRNRNRNRNHSHRFRFRNLRFYSGSGSKSGYLVPMLTPTGGCHLLGGKLVSWTSKKQNSVSTSTTEAAYVAAGICCAQVLWLRNQLQDYDIQLSKIPIYCDNTSAIAIANNPVLHSKTKHIEVRYHFIRDHVMNGDIELHFVPTEYQLADLFTKPLDVTRFNMLISELGMLNPDE
ncbi:LOW QUALITY PROTEIN: hypothetical protein OSB04_018879 [Centaurea solstitialis]|uniref:Uncharacterized protein n=1 Tax=Centaurea solstitialis TaxID=347529 RepID=A0AA38WFC0_9ASTR|nr:LOW QUALITY PROTEIN: hypothetical protein OSB04_018879 [Centaurea solstitialis]